MVQRILLSILTLVIIICLCLGAISLPGLALAVTQGRQVGQESGRMERATLTPWPVITPFPTAPSSGNLPLAVSLQMDQIQVEVIQLRGLRQLDPLIRDVLSPSQLRQRVTEDFFKDYTPEKAAQDALLLSAFGLLKPDVDLRQLYLDLYSEQIAGFYDSKTKEMYVIQGGSFGGPERMTYSHEFVHALQDQHYDLQNGLKINDEYCQDHSEYCSGVQALIEGDASLTQRLWLETFASAQDRQQIQEFYSNYHSPVYDSAPDFLKEDFLFPYRMGQEFVQTLYDQGGWQAVNEAYTNPPVSTEQILHPDRYPLDQPRVVTLPDLQEVLGKDWQELDRDTIGEWYTYLILSLGRSKKLRLPVPTARQAAAGWGGDVYVLYTGPQDQRVVVGRWKWDSQEDNQEFWRAMRVYGVNRWGKPSSRLEHRLTWKNTSDSYVTILRNELETLWLMTPDAEIASKILTALPEFKEP